MLKRMTDHWPGPANDADDGKVWRISLLTPMRKFGYFYPLHVDLRHAGINPVATSWNGHRTEVSAESSQSRHSFGLALLTVALSSDRDRLRAQWEHLLGYHFPNAVSILKAYLACRTCASLRYFAMPFLVQHPFSKPPLSALQCECALPHLAMTRTYS